MATREQLMECLFYDPETGVFTWRKKISRKVVPGEVAGRPRKDGYVRIGVLGRRYLAHRLAWLFVHGRWPEGDIDHENGDTSDNRLSNLRQATRSQNLFNQGLRKDNKSGSKGVCWIASSGKWRAGASLGGKYHYLGEFADKESAERAYQEFSKLHHKEFSYGRAL